MAYDFADVLSLWPPDNPPMITCGLCGFGHFTWVVVLCDECGQPHYAPPIGAADDRPSEDWSVPGSRSWMVDEGACKGGFAG